MKYIVFAKEGVEFIQITNDDNMKVVLADLGASIYSIQIDDKYMTLTPKNINDFKNIGNYHGKTIGGVANRVKDGVVNINGVNYQMDINEQTNCLHGGKNGLSNQYFNYEVFENNNGISVAFTFFKKHLLDGLPGNINYKITYDISKLNNEIRVNYDVISDADTILGITNHAFYCLGDHNINNLYLTIHANQYIATSGVDLLPLSYENIKDTPRDFNHKKLITKDREDLTLKDGRINGYDFHSVFSKIDCDVANLVLENNNFSMSLYTDFPGVQIYDDNMGNCSVYFSSSEHFLCGIAIEPQESLLDRPFLKANQTYSKKFKLVFSRML